MKLKVCFVGVGSIALRHIKNLNEICSEQNIILTIDALRKNNYKKYDDVKFSMVYQTEEQLPDDYDAIFITNPTDFHMDTLCALHDKSNHFFIEKPLTSISKIKEVEEFICRKDSIYYIACPLRYTAVIQYLRNYIDVKNVISVRCISSSYLPEWRPDIDYRMTYSASKELGGGVSIDLIHEWDYLKYLFGMPENIMYMNRQVSNLELDCEDIAIYMASYKDKVIELHLDYFGRKKLRKIMLITEEDTIIGDLVNNTVSYLKTGKVIIFDEKRDDYQKSELQFFLDLIQGKMINNNSIIDAYQTLKLTQGEVVF